MSKTWESLDYAAKLNEAGLAPKTKFLFKISFIINQKARDIFNKLGMDFNDAQRYLSYTIKQVSLPKISYDYEDVNLYNFRTKVLKTINYENVSASFYDDVSNNTMRFSEIYFKMLSPMGRFSPIAGDSLQDMGLEFSDDPFSGIKHSARRSAFDDFNDILEKVTIYQYSVVSNDKGKNITENLLLNSFTLANPRILSCSFEEQDHENGNTPALIQLDIAYDGVFMDLNSQDFSKDITLGYQGAIPGLDIAQGAGQYSVADSNSSLSQTTKTTTQYTPTVNSPTVTNALNKSTGTATAAANRTLQQIK